MANQMGFKLAVAHPGDFSAPTHYAILVDVFSEGWWGYWYPGRVSKFVERSRERLEEGKRSYFESRYNVPCFEYGGDWENFPSKSIRRLAKELGHTDFEVLVVLTSSYEIKPYEASRFGGFRLSGRAWQPKFANDYTRPPAGYALIDERFWTGSFRTDLKTLSTVIEEGQTYPEFYSGTPTPAIHLTDPNMDLGTQLVTHGTPEERVKLVHWGGYVLLRDRRLKNATPGTPDTIVFGTRPVSNEVLVEELPSEEWVEIETDKLERGTTREEFGKPALVRRTIFPYTGESIKDEIIDPGTKNTRYIGTGCVIRSRVQTLALTLEPEIVVSDDHYDDEEIVEKDAVEAEREVVYDFETGEVISTRIVSPEIRKRIVRGTKRRPPRSVINTEWVASHSIETDKLPSGMKFVVGLKAPRKTATLCDHYTGEEISSEVVQEASSRTHYIGTALASNDDQVGEWVEIGLNDAVNLLSTGIDAAEEMITLSELHEITWGRGTSNLHVCRRETTWGGFVGRELRFDVTFQTQANIETLVLGLKQWASERSLEFWYEWDEADWNDDDIRHVVVADDVELPLFLLAEPVVSLRKTSGDEEGIFIDVSWIKPEIGEGVVAGEIKSKWTNTLSNWRGQIGVTGKSEKSLEYERQIREYRLMMQLTNEEYIPKGRGIYAIFFLGGDSGSVLKIGRSQNIHQRVVTYCRGGTDIPDECEGIMHVFDKIMTTETADQDINEWINRAYEDVTKQVANEIGLNRVATRQEYFHVSSYDDATTVFDTVKETIDNMKMDEVLRLRDPYKVRDFCLERDLNMHAFIDRLVDVGLSDENYIERLRVHADKLD